VKDKRFIPFDNQMMDRVNEVGQRYLSFGQQHGFIDSKVLYTSHHFGDEFKALEKDIVKNHPEYEYMTPEERYNACLTLLNRLESGVDYIALPVSLKLLEYNGYEL
jgi:hypothetical protein